MRRITLFLSSLLCVGLTHAAGLWSPSMSTAPAETPIYVRINVNGTPASSGLEVAAFVDGDCRAVASTAVTLGSGTSSTPAYLLRVMGTAADQNKTITFKSFYNNLVYSFTTTATFTGEYVTPIPLDLYLDAVTGISLVNPISIVAAIPAVHDLSADVSLSYDETTRQNKSTLESELSYVWTPLSTILSVTGNMLTADAVTPPDGIQLNLMVTGPNYGSSVAKMQYSAAASTQVIVTEPVIGVTSISVSPNTITAQVGDNYLTKISELVTVTVLPTDATDKSWTASIETSSTATVSTANIITAPGTLNVTISSNSNPSATAMLAISVPTPVSFRYPAELTLSKLHAVAVNFTNLVGNNFDKSLVTVSFSNALNGEPCATASMADESGMKWNFTGLYVGNYTYQVSYDGQPMQSTGGTSAGVLHIPAEVALNSAGWDWISLYAYCAGQTAYSLTNTGGDYLAWLNTDANNRIIDVRSQDALLYNDAGWGFIGYGLYNATIIVVSMMLEPTFAKITGALHINTSSLPWKIFQIIRTFLIMAAACAEEMKIMNVQRRNRHLRAPADFDDFLTRITEMGLTMPELRVMGLSMLLFFIVSLLQENGIHIRDTLTKCPLIVRWAIYFTVLGCILVLGHYGAGYSASDFVYRNF